MHACRGGKNTLKTPGRNTFQCCSQKMTCHFLSSTILNWASLEDGPWFCLGRFCFYSHKSQDSNYLLLNFSGKETRQNCQYKPWISPLMCSPLIAVKKKMSLQILNQINLSLSGSKAEITLHVLLVSSSEEGGLWACAYTHVWAEGGLIQSFKCYPETMMGNPISHQLCSPLGQLEFKENKNYNIKTICIALGKFNRVHLFVGITKSIPFPTSNLMLRLLHKQLSISNFLSQIISWHVDKLL